MFVRTLHRGDITQLRALVDTIATKHSALAAGIRVLVDAYAYDHLRQLLASVKKESYEV